MKKLNILYWVITVIFSAYMIFTAVPNVMVSPDSVSLISDTLGYPKYFIPFIGIAKIMGAVVILIPGLKRLKEWAYAGLFFDLFSATYSIVHTWGLSFDIIFMILPVIFLFASYFLWHKKMAVLKTASL
ncbi:MAG: DoxX family protein [Chitinophagaceae bacterium]|nr:DoxX family protein [Chitinophagaceae bacterium]